MLQQVLHKVNFSFFQMTTFTFSNCLFLSGVLAVIFAISGMVLWHLASVDEMYEAKKIKVEENKQKKRRT